MTELRRSKRGPSSFYMLEFAVPRVLCAKERELKPKRFPAYTRAGSDFNTVRTPRASGMNIIAPTPLRVESIAKRCSTAMPR